MKAITLGLKPSLFLLALTFSTAALAQIPPTDPPPADHAWTKTIDTAPVTIEFDSQFSTVTTPFATETHNFHNVFKCWATVDDAATSGPSWTTAFATLYDWSSNAPVTAQANGDGNITFNITWESCMGEDAGMTTGGSPGVQRWVQEVTGKIKERKLQWRMQKP